MVGTAMTTYPETTQPDLLTSAALDARSRRALALVRALRSVARNHGHAEHAAATGGDAHAHQEARDWHTDTLKAYRLLLEALGIGPDSDDSEDAERAFQAALVEVFGWRDGSEGDKP